MGKITISLEPQFMIPTLDVYKEYFDNKYPCTDENNDGSNMSLEDEVKYATYDYLLNVYEKSKEVYLSAYNELKKKVSEIEVS
ncbi:MAG: hypothetical protein WCJ03_07190 [Bacteroidales bacterium]